MAFDGDCQPEEFDLSSAVPENFSFTEQLDALTGGYRCEKLNIGLPNQSEPSQYEAPDGHQFLPPPIWADDRFLPNAGLGAQFGDIGAHWHDLPPLDTTIDLPQLQVDATPFLNDAEAVFEARRRDQNAVPAVPAGGSMPAFPSSAVQTPPAFERGDFDAVRIHSLLDFLEEPQHGQSTIPAPATDDGYQFINPMDLDNGLQLQPQQAPQGGLPSTTLPQFLPLAAQCQHTGASQPAPQPVALPVPQPQRATQGGLPSATNPQAGAVFPPLPVLVKVAGGRYSCPSCLNKVFGTKQLAQSHVMGVHGEASGFPLLQCGNCHRGITRDPANMRRHERNCHGRAAKYQCQKCGRESTSRYNMDRHIVTCRHTQPAKQ